MENIEAALANIEESIQAGAALTEHFSRELHSIAVKELEREGDGVHQRKSPEYDLFKVALAHHRFGWIHPFGNGNGRVDRLLTYALLIK